MSTGQAHTRIEGLRKVTGAAAYALDVYPSATLHAATVGAPVAHGRITAGNENAAAAKDGST